MHVRVTCNSKLVIGVNVNMSACLSVLALRVVVVLCFWQLEQTLP